LRIVLHILLKDLRHHWREIALFVICCGTWGWDATHPMSWTHQRGMIPAVMFGLWVFLSIRVVHGECLVGDREFWQTRPYTGVQLLIAKTSFLVLCLNAPLLVVQVFLLIHAGVPMSWHLVPGLLFLQLELALYVTFPAFALAAVTESLIQWIVAVGGLLLFIFVLSWLPWDNLPSTLAGEENIGTLIGAAVIIPVLLLALVWQYARRTVWLPRLAIGVAVLVVPFVMLMARTNFIRSVAYRSSETTPPFQISAHSQTGGLEHEYFRTKGLFSEDTVDIPIDFNSTDPDLIVDIEGFHVLLNGDSSWKWQSPWLNRALNLSSNSPGGGFQFSMPSELVDQISRMHAVASVEVAFRVHRLGHAIRVDTSPRQFSIPDVGSCNWFDTARGNLSMRGYNCVAPLRLPGLFVAQINSGDISYPTEQGEPPISAGHSANSAGYGTDAVPADFDPNPVRQFDFSFGKWHPEVNSTIDPKSDRNASLCRGAPMFVRIATFAGRMQSRFDLGPMGSEKPGTVEENGEVRFSLQGR
jgi:hypothetical protein